MSAVEELAGLIKIEVREGDRLNVEVDIVAKYVARNLEYLTTDGAAVANATGRQAAAASAPTPTRRSAMKMYATMADER